MRLPIPVYHEWLMITRPAVADGAPHTVALEWAVGNRPWWVPEPPGRPCVLGTRRVSVIASGESWAYDWQASLGELAHPASVNNVEGSGLGFLAGVQRFDFTYERCAPLGPNSQCAITYGQRSATVVGIGTNWCTGGPLVGAGVTLTGGTAGRRSTGTDASGVFRFRGLDPGVQYSISVTHPEFSDVAWEALTFGEAVIDTVSFRPSPRAGCTGLPMVAAGGRSATRTGIIPMNSRG